MTNTTKTAKTKISHAQLVAAHGGTGGNEHQILWVTCPIDYRADRITADDIVHDDRISVVDAPTYRIDHADDRATEYADTYEDAIAKVREIYGDAVEIGHSGDIADGGKRTMCWASAEDAENDDGRRACCEIREEVRS